MVNLVINQLVLENFKSFKNSGIIEFNPVTLISGQNSSGKSTLLQALLLLKQTIEGPIDEPLLLNGQYLGLGGFYDIFHNKSNDNQPIKFTFSIKRGNESPQNKMLSYTPYIFDSDELIDNISVSLEFIKPQKKDITKLRLKKSSIKGAVDNDSFELTMRSNDKLVDILSEQYLLDQGTHKFFAQIMQLMVKKGIQTKSEAILFNQFLPTGILQPYNKVLIQERADALIGLIELLNDFFGVKFDKVDIETAKARILIDNYAVVRLFRRYITRVDKEVRIKRYEKIHPDVNNAIDLLLEDMIDEEQIEFIEEKKIANIFSVLTNQQIESLYQFIEERNNTINNARSHIQNLEIRNIHSLNIRHTPIRWTTINEMIRDEFKHIKYLGPLRDDPKSFYRTQGATDPTYVGAKGENVAFILKYYADREIQTIVPPSAQNKNDKWNPMDSNIVALPLMEAVDQWSRYLGIAENISVEEFGNIGLAIMADVHGNKKTNLINVGVGVSQLLPLIVMGLISSEKSILLLEQPELHLHPFVQARLADFFIALSNLGKQIIAETHSEHLINRTRLHIARGYLNNEKDVSVYFCNWDSNKLNTKVSRVNIDTYGSIEEWPPYFLDESEKILEQIMFAALDRED